MPACLLGGATSASAVAPDPTFGGDGIVTTPIGATAGDEDAAYAMAIDPGTGKIVLAGTSAQDSFAVARYNANGSPDTSFDGDGKVTTDISGPIAPTSGADEAHAVVIQPDGKIVVAGFADAFANGGGLGGNFALARYNDNGSLDASFDGDSGTGNGIVTTSAGSFESAAFALVLQDDGKLVAAGRSSAGSQYDFALVRYNANGTLDTNADGDPGIDFDTDGKVTTDVGGVTENDVANAVAIQSDGKIVAAGYSNTGSSAVSDDFALARYNADGSLDTDADGDPGTDFGGDGKVTTPISTQPTFNSDRANAVAIQSNGKIVAAGSSQVTPADQFALARYNGDGSLDTGFDGDGKVTTNISPVDNTSVAHSLAIQSDGRLVAVGRASNSDGSNFHNDFGIARYNPNGSLDPTLDGDGVATTGVAPVPQDDIARVAAIQADGKLVVGGYADMGPPAFADFDFALVRYVDVPQTTITSGPTGATDDTTPSFGFGSDEPGSTFGCRFDSDSFAVCSGPGNTHTPPGPLPEGQHTFAVRATNPDGNADPSPATRTITVDTTEPTATVTGGPSGPTTDTTPTFTFTTSDATSGVASVRCRFDAAAFGACSGAGSHTPGSPLINGPHTFEVEATDAAGNVDTDTRSFSVETTSPPSPPPPDGIGGDTTPPDTQIDGGPQSKTKRKNVTFDFSSTEPDSSFECKLDGGTFEPCASPKSYKVGKGQHSFEVRATDAAGNVDATPATDDWKVKKTKRKR